MHPALPTSTNNSRKVSVIAVVLSVILMIAAAAFSFAALVRYGESEVGQALWIVYVLLVVLQSLLFTVAREARKSHVFLASLGAGLCLAATIGLLAYIHSVNCLCP